MLTDLLKKSLADTFAFYLKTQFYHWNVEGSDFYQYHELFGDIYEEVQESVDMLAEQIRTLDEYAPGSLSRFKELTSITEDTTIPNSTTMARNLLVENSKVIMSLTAAYQQAEEDGKLGVSNFLQDRLTAHRKHEWFLRASTK
jgi:starvation-inducible DNA-binding protein